MPPPAVKTDPRQPKSQSHRKETPPIQSLDRGLTILEAVGKSPSPVTLSELTSVLKIDRSSVFRLANTLKRRGFLANPAGAKDYVLGTSVWRLSREYNWSGMLATIAHGHLQSLAGTTGETAHLAVREGRKALFVDHATANSHVISVSGQTGELVPLYCTSHGKALLADFDEDGLRNLLGNKPLVQYTINTVRTVAELAQHCNEIRKRGFASDDAEFLDGVRCVAAPIRDREGTVVASIGISAPSSRMPEAREREIADRVTRIATEITEVLNAS
jgi:IclR family transcriptional regulator, acetate operon repressor